MEAHGRAPSYMTGQSELVGRDSRPGWFVSLVEGGSGRARLFISTPTGGCGLAGTVASGRGRGEDVLQAMVNLGSQHVQDRRHDRGVDTPGRGNAV